MKLAFKSAFRFLFSNKGQTILIALGIAVGVSVQIFIGSLIQGLQKSLIDTTVGSSPHVTLIPDGDNKTIDKWEDIIEKLRPVAKSINVASPTASFPGFVEINGNTEPILLRGFVISKADEIYKVKKMLYEGKLPEEANQVIIGRDLKDSMKIKIGDNINILTPFSKKQEMKVCGYFDLKVSSINQSWIISDLYTVQELFEANNGITAIEIQVEDVFKADEVAEKISGELTVFKNIRVTNWKDQNQQLLSGLQGQSISSIMIQVFVLISVLLGIASVLAISVLQKSRQIGILKAMGVKDSVSSMIFLLQGLILGVIGGILGIAMGLLLAYSFEAFAVKPDGEPVVALYINYSFIGISAGIAILSATLAALFPAIKSSKLTPVEVIRNG